MPQPAAPAAAPPVVCLLSHTHWDREWYQPAGRFRQQLVALVDELLDTPGDAPFLLDGQAIVLEDYLAVRPERRALLAAALQSGVLEAGPWYVLADELIPGGEALVRNLLEGRRQLAALGASAPAVLYCPDSFGHPSALPDLAAGFGCAAVVLWRGYGGARSPAGDAARWRSAAGASALLFHLPPDGYEFGSSLAADGATAAERWTRLRAVLEPRSMLGVFLVHNGADHHARQRRLPEATAALRRAAAPLEVRALSLGALGAELAARATNATLPEVGGELRDSYGYTWTLQGTFATRAYQKRRNARAERLLRNEVEPLMAVAMWNADGANRARAAALARAAWRTLLQCHPHDTLCGCSTDEVARAMDGRLDDALSQGRGLRDDAVAVLAGFDAAAAREAPEAWRPALVVRNALSFARSGVAEVEILTPLAAVRVGPGSSGTLSSVAVPDEPRFARSRIVGGVPVQVLSRRVVHHRVESPLHYPSDALVLAERAVALVPPVGGLATWTTSARTTSAGVTDDLPSSRVAPAVRRGRTLGNGRISVRVGRDGSVTLVRHEDGGVKRAVELSDLLAFESAADGGDLYTPSPRGTPVAARFAGARVAHDGPLRAGIALRYVLALPRSLGDERTARVIISATLLVDAGSDVLRVRVRGRNRARDHRLRARFSTGLAGATTVADAAFGPVERRPIDVPHEDARAEAPPATAPMHRYVSRYGASSGATVIGDGLAEYEAAADGAVYVTLLRAVGELSRPDLAERPGHAGWPRPTPGAQCIGDFRASFGVALHGSDSDRTRAQVDRLASEFLLPLRGTTLRAHAGLPDWDDPAARSRPTAIETAPVELSGDGLALSALKIGADPTWTVARAVNVGAGATSGAWSFGQPVREAVLARLDETPIAPLEVDGSVVRFEAGPRAIVTILVR